MRPRPFAWASAQTSVDPDLTVEPVLTGLARPTTMAFVAPDDFLFLGFCSTPLSRTTVGYRLRLVLRRLGIYRKTVREQGVVQLSPSLHSLRHSFAVHRLEQWYREGVDVLSKLPFLSTYLGHVKIAHTQHYLTILPDLLREAGRRFARHSDDGDFLRP